MDLAKQVSCTQTYVWTETLWSFADDGRSDGFGTLPEPRFHVVAVDFGAKRNILRNLASQGCRVTVVPATATADEILGHNPDGVFLANGPGDPAATGIYAVPELRRLVDRSEEHTSELQSLMRISYAVFCLKKQNHTRYDTRT